MFRKLQNLKFFLKQRSKDTFGDLKKKEDNIAANINKLNLQEENGALSEVEFLERAGEEIKLNEIKVNRAKQSYQRDKV